MSRRVAFSRRSTGEWLVRGLITLVALLLAYVSLSQTLASVVRRGNPERALALAPNDGRSAAALAQKLSGPEASARQRARASALARSALREDPTTAAAASTLGLNIQLTGDATRARRLFAYAERLSRRDLQTQIWAIEDAVARGDVSGALRHYDIALRTSRDASGLLFPVLATAIAEPGVRQALATTLLGRPAWAASLIDYLAATGPEPRATAALFTQLRRGGIMINPAASAGVINALVARGALDDAWRYYASLRGVTDRGRSRDPGFAANLDAPSSFDWVPINASGSSASIQRTEKGGLVDFSAASSVGGTLLQQVQLLPPGNYRLDGHSIAIEQPAGAAPFFSLTCQGGQQLGRVEVPNSAVAGGRFSGRFNVPPGCPIQVLMLVAQPSTAVGGLSGQLDRVSLTPERGS